MTVEIPACEPTELVAGDAWEWDRSLPGYSASAGWRLAYSLRGPTDLDVEWATHVTASGDGFAIRIPGSVSAALAQGTYSLTGFVSTGADDRRTVVRATLLVHPDPSSAVDARSHDEKTLALIDAAIEGRIPPDLEESTIGGRQVKHIPIETLLHLQGVYRTRVAAALADDDAFGTVEAVFGFPG